MSADFKYFPRLFEEVIEEVRKEYDSIYPLFEYGTYLELIEKCTVKDNNQQSKYPLVWLVWDQNENQQKWIEPYIYTISPRVFICSLAERDNNTEERYTAPLESVLYPIFEILLSELSYHPNIVLGSDFAYPVNDHPFWLNNTEGNFDHLSAIEIKFENLQMFKN